MQKSPKGGRNGRLRASSFVLTILAPSTTALAATWHVDHDAPAGGNGLTWQTPFKKLRDAIAEVEAGDTIKVAVGTYYPDEREGQADGGMSSSFELPENDMKLFGGFAGYGQADPDERDVVIYLTVLSGDITQDDATNPDQENNVFHVVTALGNDGAVIDGFTIEAGNADDIGTEGGEKGGGMYIDGSAVLVSRCVFRNNRASEVGGGVGLVVRDENSDRTRIQNCQFHDNSAEDGGGGISAEMLLDHELEGSPTDEPHMWVVNSLFFDNATTGNGGAVWLAGATNVLKNCTIAFNDATMDQFDSGRAGGVYRVNNGAFGFGSNHTLTHCILWGNTGEEDTSVEEAQITTFVDTNDVLVVEQSDIEGLDVLTGNDNIGDDPEFADEAADDYHLAFGSPCIQIIGEAGTLPGDTLDYDDDNDTTEAPPDIDIEPRFTCSLDAGADEFRGEACDWDLGGDLCVGFDDLTSLLVLWGPCPSPPEECPGDFDGTGDVGFGDLVLLLVNWGPCPGGGESLTGPGGGGSAGLLAGEAQTWLAAGGAEGLASGAITAEAVEACMENPCHWTRFAALMELLSKE